ncbi:MAG: NTP transferase domain-containing protein [Longicatena sp.]
MNAIILAAGVGLRMREVALQGHKAFLPIGRIPMIERLILYLHEAQISDITIVTGHMKDLFLPLKEKYKVKLVHNKKYSMNNNLHSLELVLDEVGDTFIIHGDVAIFKNVFKQKNLNSFFYTILKESRGIPLLHPEVNKSRVITNFYKYAGPEAVTTMLGISYWTKEDAVHLKEYFKENISEKIKRYHHREWEEEILNLSKKIPIEAHQLDRKYARDVNLMRDYFEACYIYDEFWKER